MTSDTDARVAVSAILVNWRQPDLTSAAVASLERQTGLAERGLELAITIVDNGSGDGSLEVLRERHPQHLVVDGGRNDGFGAGVNTGIRARPADVYVLLNNDAEAEPGFVAALVDELRGAEGRGAVTARILLAGTHPVLVNSTGNEMTRSGNGRDRDWLVPAADEHRPAGEVMGFSGGAAALDARALDDVGLFDESLFMYYEDTDLSWRLRRAGWSIRYTPDAVVRHAHAASSGTGSDVFRFSNERNRMLVALRHAPAPVALTAVARTAAGTLRALVAVARTPTPAHRADARRRLRSFGSALRLTPANLARRVRIDRSARAPRRAVAAFLVAE
ncbi:glycosyltransferase family 2 protein [Herbiconiux sp. CPCC 205716]|uniref:Glycosyltransferase family 2 protein n=1 Tax=Herbiconiux gentiana TaxID=2970912 RepID=A0ABT2GJ00_9MICO|nr:glycosyltransferase family 2 protein [Herbiconiux gentiana]MCS5716208.1 glycosyltransferase family 2 protein [Herbiconiux gentiana]